MTSEQIAVLTEEERKWLRSYSTAPDSPAFILLTRLAEERRDFRTLSDGADEVSAKLLAAEQRIAELERQLAECREALRYIKRRVTLGDADTIRDTVAKCESALSTPQASAPPQEIKP